MVKKLKKRQDNIEALGINLKQDYVYFFGQKYLIQLINEKAKSDYEIKENNLVIYLANPRFSIERVTKKIEKDFCEILINKFKEFSEYYAKEILPEKRNFEIKLSKARLTRIWASNFVSKNLITVSRYLLHFNDEIIKSIVVHELSHFIYQNHSKDFYKLVIKHFPEYKKAKHALDNHLFNY
ncbi:YgjP-like metallopeptidase domain-containing protein [Mycoplasma struthionis]|uniref:M48 family metallopeptidase n=1 Tax=Mycoplasma struthionis TaxID=538220 RepID=A0A502MI50_9MOLU|nr:YgjP-like metallopeptidase domain-containing protein [Mycoplasma struthionis]TPI01157.1 M48 family metallopeptidase [Mycoplasma struthionis]